MRYLSWMSMFFILGGCGIGGYWMNGNPSAGKNIQPYIEYWVKDGATNDERLRIWVACGGQINGSFWYKKDRLSGETVANAITRQDHEFEHCMIRAGYRYTGNCSSEYMKSQPLCGAPLK